MRKRRVAALGGGLFVALAFVSTSDSLTPAPLPPVHPTAPIVVPSLGGLDAWGAQREMDADVLAELAMAEDPHAGAAVMWTVLNRAGRSGAVILEVVTEPGQYGTRRVWPGEAQPRWRPAWTPRATRRWSNALDARMLWRLRLLAHGILLGRIPDPTGGATHFNAVGSPLPGWVPEEISRLGRSLFYRLT